MFIGDLAFELQVGSNMRNKKLELFIPRALVERCLSMLQTSGLSGYTVQNVEQGMGAGAGKTNNLAFGSSAIHGISVGSEYEIEKAIDRLMPLLRESRAFGYVTPVERVLQELVLGSASR